MCISSLCSNLVTHQALVYPSFLPWTLHKKKDLLDYSPSLYTIKNKQQSAATYPTHDLKRDGGVMVLQRRDVVVANGKLSLSIDLITVNKVYKRMLLIVVNSEFNLSTEPKFHVFGGYSTYLIY